MLLNLTILRDELVSKSTRSKPYSFFKPLLTHQPAELWLQHKNIGGAALAAVEDPLPADTVVQALPSSVWRGVLMWCREIRRTIIIPITFVLKRLLRLRRELARTRTCVLRFVFLHWKILHRCAQNSSVEPTLLSGASCWRALFRRAALDHGHLRSRVATNTMTYDDGDRAASRALLLTAHEAPAKSFVCRQSQCSGVLAMARGRDPLRERLSGRAAFSHVCGLAAMSLVYALKD